jgi:hypothetical protein
MHGAHGLFQGIGVGWLIVGWVAVPKTVVRPSGPIASPLQGIHDGFDGIIIDSVTDKPAAVAKLMLD